MNRQLALTAFHIFPTFTILGRSLNTNSKVDSYHEQFDEQLNEFYYYLKSSR